MLSETYIIQDGTVAIYAFEILKICEMKICIASKVKLQYKH